MDCSSCAKHTTAWEGKGGNKFRQNGMLQPRRAASGLHQKILPVQLLTEEVNSNHSLDLYGALNPRNTWPLFIFFPALAHRWGRSIRKRLSHKSSWTLAGIRPKCPGLWAAAVIQYTIFIYAPKRVLMGEADENRRARRVMSMMGRKGEKRGSKGSCKIGR